MTKNKQCSNPDKRRINSHCPVYGGAHIFYEGKTQVMHSNIDTAERGQVPNASQLDPAQTQADGRTEGGEGGKEGDYRSSSPISDVVFKKHSKTQLFRLFRCAAKEPIIHFKYDSLQMI